MTRVSQLLQVGKFTHNITRDNFIVIYTKHVIKHEVAAKIMLDKVVNIYCEISVIIDVYYCSSSL